MLNNGTSWGEPDELIEPPLFQGVSERRRRSFTKWPSRNVKKMVAMPMVLVSSGVWNCERPFVLKNQLMIWQIQLEIYSLIYVNILNKSKQHLLIWLSGLSKSSLISWMGTEGPLCDTLLDLWEWVWKKNNINSHVLFLNTGALSQTQAPRKDTCTKFQLFL